MGALLRWGWALCLAAAAAGCGGTARQGDGSVAQRETVLVLAASSLTEAFAEIEEAFEAADPRFDVQLSLAGSPSLVVQVEEGIPADVVATANTATMARAAAAGALADEPVPFATNRLVIAVPVGNPEGVSGPADLARPDLLVGVCAVGVPCGDAASDVLDRAGVEAAIDTYEPNVRALLTKLVDGELDVVLVYATDVLAGLGSVEAVELSEDVAVTVTATIAPLADAPHPDGAQAFVAFLISPQGRRILTDNGFALP